MHNLEIIVELLKKTIVYLACKQIQISRIVLIYKITEQQ